MARIELRNCLVRFKDGLGGVAAVNQPGTPPVATDTTLTIDDVVLNTAITTKVPVGARFTIAGETAATTVHTVTARTQGPVAGANAKQSVSITATGGTFTLAWGGEVTGTIAFDADAATVKAALVAMDDGYSASDWDVTGVAGAWVVEFTGLLGLAPQALLVGDGALLTGGSTTVTVETTQVGAAATTVDDTVGLTFAPALGAGTYADGGILTFLPQQIEIKMGDGNITYSEHDQYDYMLDRGDLDSVRQGDQVPMDVKIDAVYEHITTGTSEAISPMDALKGIGGAAEWVSSSSDLCEPYAIDIEVEHEVPCGTSQDETTLFPDFRSETRDVDFKAATIAVSGKCNATQPIVTRS